MQQPTDGASSNLSPWGVYVHSVCFLRNRIHPAHLSTGILQILSIPSQRLPTCLISYTALRSRGGVSGTLMHLIKVSCWCHELSPPAQGDPKCGTQIPQTMLLCTPILCPKQVPPVKVGTGAALTVTHRGAGASPSCGILGPAMQRPMCIANTESDLYKHVTCSTQSSKSG